MKKEKITEEMKVHEQWYKDAEKVTIDNLVEFINHLMNDYEHDYGTICHAIGAASIATAWAMNKHEQGGITGFQAGAIMWSFVRHWTFSNNKTGLKILDYDNMLFPQYQSNFEKSLDQSTWDRLREEAKSRLEDKTSASKKVTEHWKSIVNGVVPFGYTISEE